MFIVISHTNPDPMYVQVMEQVKDAVARGELQTGEKLPSIRELSRDLSISPITIKRAYRDLEREGYIFTRSGMGSYVAAINRDHLREGKLNEIRREMRSLLVTAGKYGIPLHQLQKILRELKEEQDG
ncbi:MAG: GntR family transcriptional regulator [Candidatus Krumholzibacteriota bacterium]|nr:GntR family transcriptional regulator [Candidatus Krumholzibacteriota bacterium]